jgi:hypothetical protein
VWQAAHNYRGREHSRCNEDPLVVRAAAQIAEFHRLALNPDIQQILSLLCIQASQAFLVSFFYYNPTTAQKVAGKKFRFLPRQRLCSFVKMILLLAIARYCSIACSMQTN